MESVNSNGCGCSLDFGFGFNDVKFSDRTIRLHLIPDPIHSNGHQVVESNGNPSSMDYSTTQIKTIHISTLILAAKSPFFYKLFSNGMVESNQQHVTLRIQNSAEAAFMDMLKFMYTNTLSSTTPSALLDVLIAADKYEVESCTKYCFQLLKKLPMTRELTLQYLDLPSTVLMADMAQSLTDSAKEFLVARFNDLREFEAEMLEEEILNLPLAGVEVVLSSDDLQVYCEDEIYDFVMRWAQRHYTKPGERQEILITHLLRLIRFPFISCQKLEGFLTCPDVNLELSSKLVFDALSFKIPHRQLTCIPQERAYKLRPVKVIRFDSPNEEYVVYLDLKHEECARLLPLGHIFSQNFSMGGQLFYLTVARNVDEQSSYQSLGFYLGMLEIGSLHVEYEFFSRRKLSEEFEGKYIANSNCNETEHYGSDDLFNVPWDTFIADDSPYFINGVLRLRAVLKVKKEV